MITLKNQKLTAQILPLGATLTGLWHRDLRNSLVLGSTDPTAYKSDLKYAGAIVGPVANRIRQGRVNINGTDWQMPQNEGAHCLHSGPSGLHSLEWRITEQTQTAVTLACFLPEKAIGLPGNRTVTVQYSLHDTDMLRVQIHATTDAETLMNPAHHPYWNLDGSTTIKDHLLSVPAETYLQTDKTNVPTGEQVPVTGTDYDFRTPALIPTDRTLDANLCLATSRRDTPELAATLCVAKGPTLTLETTEPGLQVYNGSGLQSGGTMLHDGAPLRPFAGVALEPQGWPDAPNHRNFPSILLSPDETYSQHILYRIS